MALHTIGHSDRQADELFALLRDHAVQTLVDVRIQPSSRRFPHFNRDALRTGAERSGMVYHWCGRHLGGRRPARPDSPHVALPEGLRGYADHMQGEAFQRTAAWLIGLAAKGEVALMCAERLPEQCHRSLIADYLTLQGVRVVHLIDTGHQREHTLRPEARAESRQPVYDRHTNGTLQLE